MTVAATMEDCTVAENGETSNIAAIAGAVQYVISIGVKVYRKKKDEK